jgi:hypothetical protein
MAIFRACNILKTRGDDMFQASDASLGRFTSPGSSDMRSDGDTIRYPLHGASSKVWPHAGVKFKAVNAHRQAFIYREIHCFRDR